MIALGEQFLITKTEGANHLRAPQYAGDVGYDIIASDTVRLGPHRTPTPLQRKVFGWGEWWPGMWDDFSWRRLRDLKWAYKRVLYRALFPFFTRPLPSYAKIPTTVCVQIPHGYFGMVLPRSQSNGSGLFVMTGVIDTGYRGPLFALVHNLNDYTHTIHKGYRVAQLVLFPSSVHRIKVFDELEPSARGHNGFGSTGK